MMHVLHSLRGGCMTALPLDIRCDDMCRPQEMRSRIEEAIFEALRGLRGQCLSVIQHELQFFNLLPFGSPIMHTGSDVSGYSQELEDLEDRICRQLASSRFDARAQDFLPANCIEDLITKDSIRKELGLNEDETSVTDSHEQLVAWIHSEAKKVFAITIQCSMKDYTLMSLKIFWDHGFNDDHLPVHNLRIRGYEDLPKHFPRKIWTPKRLRSFWDYQWTCLTPVFARNTYNYDISSECILPFTWKDEMYKEGAFSCVYRVKIHPAHQGHEFNEVAIKEIHTTRGGDKEGTERAWEKEAMALDAINGINHDNVIKCLAAIRRGDHRYFMFPWANGGSLRDFWETTPKQTPRADIIRQVITQLRGLADALYQLHNYAGKSILQDSEFDQPTLKIPDLRVQDEVVVITDDSYSQSIRHGDLKPENILRFLSDTTMTADLGVLKLADMGLAKRHVVLTQDRKCLTSTRYGTIQYEAPETVTALEGEGRSRLYDIWSMGCIVLESIIWILYGNMELKNFYKQVQGDTQETRYFETQADGTGADVHHIVRRWMDHIHNSDPECTQESAIRDLLELVRTKLLVVDLPPRRPSNMMGNIGPHLEMPGLGEDKKTYRINAESFVESLDAIISKMGNENYVRTGKGRENVKAPAKTGSEFLTVSSARRNQGSPIPRNEVPGGLSVDASVGKITRADYALPPLEEWEFPVDNAFAGEVLATLGPHSTQPILVVPARLCNKCENLNFWAGGFSIEYKILDLQERSGKCEFCRMMFSVCTKAGTTKASTVRFERNESTLRLSGSQSLPVLSIFRSPESKPPLPIQLGFPELLTPGTAPFFKLVELWLKDCDRNHEDCREIHNYLPTRLIDVGTTEAPRLLLLETRGQMPSESKYIALSHPWGDTEKNPPFRTLRSNIGGEDSENHLKGIPYDKLPATFKDAVDTTRALKIRHLWIDSICIIQGDGGDFSEEAKHMEDVFSCAYCVLAASRATSQHSGFLKDQPQREYLTFRRGNEKPFYVCQPVDDFNQDVLEGSLNSRGWVLQERALARRTVFFTENQTYFECGKGVRCQTLAKMHNNMADFLGDPKFPNKAIMSPRGLKIRYFQDLYKQYSRLKFSHMKDRPFAIAGVENRLCKAYGTKGGFGIFDDGPGNGLFHRSLLWQRAERDEEGNRLPWLSEIMFPIRSNTFVPSWSWMAYSGGIDYLDPKFDKTDWEKADIHPPWTRGSETTSAAETVHDDAGIELIATARDYNVAGARVGDFQLLYDTELNRSDGSRVQCVVVARSKEGGTANERKHYVLLVVSTTLTGAGGNKVYRRVGAGHMLGKYIAVDKPGTRVRIH